MTQANDEQELRPMSYRVKDAARLMNISEPIFLDLLHTDGFPAFRVGKRWIIPARAFEEWLNNQVGKQL